MGNGNQIIGCHVNFCKRSIKDSVFTWYNGNYDQSYHLLQGTSSERYVKFLALIFIKYLRVQFCSVIMGDNGTDYTRAMLLVIDTST